MNSVLHRVERSRALVDSAIQCLIGASIEDFARAQELLNEACAQLAPASDYLKRDDKPALDTKRELGELKARLVSARRLLHQCAATRFGLAAQTFGEGTAYSAGGSWKTAIASTAGAVVWIDG